MLPLSSTKCYKYWLDIFSPTPPPTLFQVPIRDVSRAGGSVKEKKCNKIDVYKKEEKSEDVSRNLLGANL